MKIQKVQTFVILGRADFDYAAGIDTYKGIIVLFDEDFDQRIFVFLKKYYEVLIPSVKAVYETEGTITLFCNKKPTTAIEALVGKSVEVSYDSWFVQIKDLTQKEDVVAKDE